MQSYFEIYKTNLVLLIFHIAFQVLLNAVGILLHLLEHYIYQTFVDNNQISRQGSLLVSQGDDKCT